MAEPGEQRATGRAGRGHLRASDADREQVVDTLKTAFVQGRLTWDELGTRTGQALVSRTHAELAAITADIPGGWTAARPEPTRPPARKLVSKRAAAWACVIISPALGAAFLTYYGGFFVLLLFAFIGLIVTAEPDRHRS